MGQFGEHFGANYDVKKIQNLLPKRYTGYGVQKKRTMVEKYYSTGQIIEAFAVLYAIIEVQLIEVFRIKLQSDLQSKPWIELEFKHEWEYAQLIRVLNEIAVLNDNEFQKFKLFQDGRHKAIHQLPLPYLHDKISKNNLDNAFRSGLEAYDIAESKLKILMHLAFRDIDWDKHRSEILNYMKEQRRIRIDEVKKRPRK